MAIDETRTFDLDVILSVVANRHVAAIHSIYECLEWMTMSRVITAQLPRANQECAPLLEKQFPELRTLPAYLPRLDHWLALAPTCPEEGVNMWLAELKMIAPQFRDSYDVPQFPLYHADIDPAEEAWVMGADHIVYVHVGQENAQ